MKRTRLGWMIALALATAAASVPAQGPHQLRDLWLAAERLLGPFEAPEATRLLLRRVVADLRRLDLRSLYEALPDSGRPDGARLVVFAATRSAGRGSPRRLEHSALRSPLSTADLFEPAASGDPLAPIGPAIGDGWLVGGTLPLDVERFRVRASTALRIGDADLAAAGAIAADFLRRVEQRARSASGVAALSTTLAEDFPATSELLGRYMELRGEVAWSEQQQCLRLAPLVTLRREALVADYPLFARFLARATKVLRSRSRWTDEGGAPVAAWSFLGPEGLAAEAAFRDGRLLPLSAEAGGAAHDLERPLRLHFANDASIEALGLRTSITGLRGLIALDPPAGRSTTSLAGMPETTALDGALFGVLGPDALDLLVPGSIEGILRDLLRSVLEGREKRGIDLVIRSGPSGGEGNVVRSDLALDVSSARLVRVALAIGARWLYPDDAETEEARRFARAVVATLRQDSSSRKRSTTGAISQAWVTTKR